MIGRSAQANSLDAVEVSGFPTVRVPAGHESNWTFIHAITRQESQFDRAAISHAGARGMMQLMPATANEVAGKLGLSYNRDLLTTDTNYNMTLGRSEEHTSELQSLMRISYAVFCLKKKKQP